MFNLKITRAKNEIVRGLASRETIIFCGAGISFNSGIPVVKQLMSAILEKLGFEDEEMGELLESFPSFEGFMQLLLENVGGYDLFEVFEPADSENQSRFANHNHSLISGLMKSGRVKTVITTNFDRLIEDALQWEEPRWRENIDYDVYYLEQGKGGAPGYADIDWKKVPFKPRIIKIHGSMHQKDELAITLTRVASENYSSSRAAVIDHAFNQTGTHKQVLILGYSCSDVFDISPAIERIGKNLQIRVMLVEHIFDQTKQRAEDIRIKEDRNPFGNFSNGTRLYYNTDELVRFLAGKLLPGNYTESTHHQFHWRRVIDQWHLALLGFENGAALHGIRGRILQYTGQLKAAEEEFKKAIALNSKVEETAFGEDCWRRLGEAYESLADYNAAITAFRNALRISRKIKNLGTESRHLCSLANVYLAMEDRPSSSDIVRDRIGDRSVNEAMKFNRNWELNKGEIKALAGKPRNIIELLLHAQDLAQAAHDEESEQRVWASLGDLYYLAGKYYYVLTYYQRGLELAEKTGDIGGQVQLLCSLGDAHSDLGKTLDAVKCYARAGELLKETGLKKFEAASIYGLGRVERINGYPARSYPLMQQALSISHKIGDGRREILCLIQLGGMDTDQKNFSNADSHLQEALRIIEQTKNKEFESECVGRLGIVHQLQHDYQKAGYLYDRALAVARKVGNQSQEALWLSHSGYNYQFIPGGNRLTALELTEWAMEIARKTQNTRLETICMEKYHMVIDYK